MSQVSHIYDALFSFESKKRTEAYPIHKKIEFEGGSLLDWVEKTSGAAEGVRILDAGCGTGNTLFQFHHKHKATGIGLTLSQQEVDFAMRQAGKIPDADLQFLKRDFASDLKDLGEFDLVICIESLKHTPEPQQVIESLSQRLKPGGKLVIVDDLLVSDRNATGNIERHKDLWHAPGFVSIGHMETMLKSTFNVKPQKVDFSDAVPAKKPLSRMLIMALMRLFRLFSTRKGQWRRNLDTYLGAMILESLYASKEVGYYALIIQKEPK